MSDPETVIKKVLATAKPEPEPLQYLNWGKMAIWVGGISAFWLSVQALVPDDIAHIIGTVLVAVSNMVMFMMKSQKDFTKTGERRGGEKTDG